MPDKRPFSKRGARVASLPVSRRGKGLRWRSLGRENCHCWLAFSASSSANGHTDPTARLVRLGRLFGARASYFFPARIAQQPVRWAPRELPVRPARSTRRQNQRSKPPSRPAPGPDLTNVHPTAIMATVHSRALQKRPAYAKGPAVSMRLRRPPAATRPASKSSRSATSPP